MPARSVGPTAAQERYEFLDVLRGVALAGIALANMISLSLYLYLSESEKASLSTASTDHCSTFSVLGAAVIALIVALVFSVWGVIPPGTFVRPGELLLERFGFTPETRLESRSGTLEALETSSC